MLCCTFEAKSTAFLLLGMCPITITDIIVIIWCDCPLTKTRSNLSPLLRSFFLPCSIWCAEVIKRMLSDPNMWVWFFFRCSARKCPIFVIMGGVGLTACKVFCSAFASIVEPFHRCFIVEHFHQWLCSSVSSPLLRCAEEQVVVISWRGVMCNVREGFFTSAHTSSGPTSVLHVNERGRYV